MKSAHKIKTQNFWFWRVCKYFWRQTPSTSTAFSERDKFSSTDVHSYLDSSVKVYY